MENLLGSLKLQGFKRTIYSTDINGEVFFSKTFSTNTLPLLVAQFEKDEPEYEVPEEVILEMSQCGKIFQYCMVSSELEYFDTVDPTNDQEKSSQFLEMFNIFV